MPQDIKIAVLGCGYWGKNLVRNLHSMGRLAAVCDVSARGREVAAQIAPDCHLLSNVEDLLAAEVDGVMIATPPATHCDLALRAIEAGKDVFVEKPLSVTYSDAVEVVQAGEQNERILMVGHLLEYHPAILRLLEIVRDRGFGKVQYIYSNRLSLGKIRREENILWSFAPHDISIVLRITGSLPFQVIACGGSYVQPNVADVTLSHFLFDNGLRAHIHVSWLHPFKEQRLVVVGSRQMVTYDDVEKRLLLYDQRVDFKEGEPIPVKSDGRAVPFDGEEPLRLECEAFVEAVTSRRPPLTDGWSALRVLRVLQAAQRSLILNGESVIISTDGGYFDKVGRS